MLPIKTKELIGQDSFVDGQLSAKFANPFMIELECPSASRNFSEPGPLELLLISLW
jgi:hypothetical protein